MKHLELLTKFDQQTSELKNKFSNFASIAKDAFIFKVHPGKIDLLLCSAIHGNEIAGISVINNFLELILQNKLSPKINMAFLVANREAVMINKRQVINDLNRSFLKEKLVTIEDFRARELELLAENCVAIFDIHQTTSASITPFFVMKQNRQNLNLLKALDLELWPVILYKEGSFSKDGSAYSAYGFNKNITFLTVELDQAGVQPVLEETILKALIKIITHQTPTSWSELLNSITEPNNKNVFFQEYKNIVKTSNDDCLMEGLKNLSLIAKDTVFYIQNKQQVAADQDYYALFPKYGIYRDTSSELIRLLVKEK